MSRSQPPSRALATLGYIALGIATFIGTRTVYFHMRDMIVVDPFARLREEENSGVDDSVGIRLANVRVRSYRNGKLVTSALADRIDISKQDRQMFTLTGIHDGVFKQDGNTYRYEANQAFWRANARQLSISGSPRLQTADLDLRTQNVEFDEGLHLLRTAQPVSGRVYHGTLTAQTFQMNTQTQEYETGPVEYRGDLAMLAKQDDDVADTKLWKITGEGSKAKRNDKSNKNAPLIRYFIEGRAQDDEMILKADLVAWNKDTDIVEADGNVKYYSAKSDITADKAMLYRKEKRVVLTGHVTIYVKPKTEEGKPPAEETTPAFQRVGPEQLVAGAGDSKTSTGSTALAGSLSSPLPPGASAAVIKDATVAAKQAAAGTPSTSAGADTSAPAVRSATAPTQSTTPDTAVATQAPAVPTPTSPTPTPTGTGGAPQTPSSSQSPANSQVPPKRPAQPATGSGQKGGAAKKEGKTQSPEEKKLDDELRNAKSLRSYPMVILCDQVTDWYHKGQRHAHIVGSPQGRQDLAGGRWRYVWSNIADYDAEKDELTLFSTPEKIDVRMKNSKGDDLKALILTVSTEEDSDVEEYSGKKVSFQGQVDNDSDTATDKKKTPAAGNGVRGTGNG